MKTKFWYMNLITIISGIFAFMSLGFMAIMYLVIKPEGDLRFRELVAVPLIFFVLIIFGIRIVGEILTDKMKREKIKNKKNPSKFFCLMAFEQNKDIQNIVNNLKPILQENHFKLGNYQNTTVFLLSSFFTAPKILRLHVDKENRVLLEAFTLITKRRSGKTYEEDFDGFYDAISKRKFKMIIKKIIDNLVSNDAKIIEVSESI